MEEKEIRVIPFVKPVRVGNYKLWRSKYKVTVTPTDDEREKVRKESGGRKKAVAQSYDIEQINVSNIDGSWKVCIPQTSMMFSNIMIAYAGDNDEDSEHFLTMLFTNFLSVTTISNAYIHDAFSFLLDMMQYPYMLLSEKEMEKRMKESMKDSGWDKAKIKEHIAKWMEYRRKLYAFVDEKIQAFVADYEADMAKSRSQEDEAQRQLEQDDIAEQAMDVLDKESGV